MGSMLETPGLKRGPPIWLPIVLVSTPLMLNAGGGCDSAIAARCCAAWGKFRKLLSVLTTRHLSPRVRGKVYSTCIRSAIMLLRSEPEPWGPNASNLQRLRRNNHSMIRWICGSKARNETPSDQLPLKLCLTNILVVVRSRWLRWFGHVQCAESCINTVI